jgi:hypothetical protein
LPHAVAVMVQPIGPAPPARGHRRPPG